MKWEASRRRKRPGRRPGQRHRPSRRRLCFVPRNLPIGAASRVGRLARPSTASQRAVGWRSARSLNAFAIVILAALLGAFAIDLIARLLDVRALGGELPPEFRGLYDPDAYARSQEYSRARTRFRLLESTVWLAALLAFWFSGGFRWADHLVRGLGLSPVPTGLLFIGLLALGSAALGLPFRAYSTFVVEEQFGFNRTTPRTFLLDLAKSAALAIAFGGAHPRAHPALLRARRLQRVDLLLDRRRRLHPARPGHLPDLDPALVQQARAAGRGRAAHRDPALRRARRIPARRRLRHRRVAPLEPRQRVLRRFGAAPPDRAVRHPGGAPSGARAGGGAGARGGSLQAPAHPQDADARRAPLRRALLSAVGGADLAGAASSVLRRAALGRGRPGLLRPALHPGRAGDVGGAQRPVATARVPGRPLRRRDHGRRRVAGRRAQAAGDREPVEPHAASAGGGARIVAPAGGAQDPRARSDAARGAAKLPAAARGAEDGVSADATRREDLERSDLAHQRQVLFAAHRPRFRQSPAR